MPRDTLQSRRIEGYIDTIWAIAASPYVANYIIGYTSTAGWTRFSQYKHIGHNHLVILVDRLTEIQAKNLERIIQAEIKLDKRHTLYKKYHEEKRDLPYYLGKKSSTPTELIHSVYMAWHDRLY